MVDDIEQPKPRYAIIDLEHDSRWRSIGEQAKEALAHHLKQRLTPAFDNSVGALVRGLLDDVQYKGLGSLLNEAVADAILRDGTYEQDVSRAYSLLEERTKQFSRIQQAARTMLNLLQDVKMEGSPAAISAIMGFLNDLACPKDGERRD